MHNKHDICQQEKSSSFWDRKISSNRNNIIRSPIYKDKYKKVIAFLDDNSEKIIDVGFGYGYFEQLISKRGKNKKIWGIDYSSKAVSYAKKHLNGNYQKGDIAKLSYSNGFFDSALLLDVLEHLTMFKVNKVLKEINRILKRNGKLVVSVPLNELEINFNNNGHIQRFTLNTLREAVEKSGFVLKKYVFLYAFNRCYFIRNIFNRITKKNRPNLVICLFEK